MKSLKSFIFYLLAFSTFTILSINATTFGEIDYKNIKDNAKIVESSGIWTQKVDKKTNDYIVKKISSGRLNYSEFYSKQGDFLFSTGTQYEFIYKGSLIGYSNSELKFYEFTMNDGILKQRELEVVEVAELFPKYKILKMSEFGETNSKKIKKKTKLILLNDTDRIFDNYGFTTNNSKFALYPLKGFINIEKKGMIQFSRFGENTKNYPWFVILAR